MKYAYYPGCSLTESAREYDASTRLVMADLGAQVEEIEDWTCCGASAVESVSRLLTYTLPARNLALVERAAASAGRDARVPDVLVPCAACYLNLLRVGEEAGRDRALAGNINEVLAVEDMHWSGAARVRHLLDVLVNDVGADAVREAVIAPLKGLVVAPYYGCQILRPYPKFDDPEHPRSMEPLIEALGAETYAWSSGARCCGASLMATKKEVALRSTGRILLDAQGADVIVTVCPMCQMNLEAYQSEALAAVGGGERVAVAYLPQLMGLAFGLDEEALLLARNMELTRRFRDKVARRFADAPQAEPQAEPETEPA
ncbi:MAG: CoB--CoM heterodisulfide reductase iron-sulfur subunit B family protein [Desulfovibrionaceae bacterium]|jgi:heterodisulfide reductase subunit B|nr:CoB--CoM heterodisulfide reductase iron-sulfur subunit B family protein [Desulfovibrionaceae bacterium]